MKDQIERQELELKEEITNFRDVSKTACAFANAHGGRLIVGISDSGTVKGVLKEQLNMLQRRIEGAIQTVSPVPFHKIVVEKRNGEYVVIVEVYQLGEGTFCTLGGITYVRVGSENRKLEGRTLQDYLANRRVLSFGNSRSPAKAEDLDIEKFQHYLRKRSPDVQFDPKEFEQFLVNLRFAKQNAEVWANNACVLFFAKNPSRFLPQNEIKLARFSGTEPVDIIDSRFSNLTIPENIKSAEEFIKKNTRVAYKIGSGMERKEVPEYPASVVREALVNAFTHRDYFSSDAIQVNIFDDSLEVINPGSIPPGLDMKLLGRLSVQRNPLIYLTMRDLKFVEGLATGIPRMRRDMRAASLPEPRFEDLGNFFRVTLRLAKPRDSFSTITERQKKALDHLEKNASITSRTYAKLASISTPTAVSDLNALVKKGLLKKEGKTRGAYYILKAT